MPPVALHAWAVPSGGSLQVDPRLDEALNDLWAWDVGRALIADGARQGVRIWIDTMPEPSGSRVFGDYSPVNRDIRINAGETWGATSWVVAGTLAHELAHASDDLHGVPMATSTKACYQTEIHAFGTMIDWDTLPRATTGEQRRTARPRPRPHSHALGERHLSHRAESWTGSDLCSLLRMDDDAFLRAFETGTLPNAAFHHRDHLRLAWLYLRRDGPELGAEHIVDGIRHFAASHAAADRFHLTLTRFWIRLVQHLMEAFPSIERFEDLLAAFPPAADKAIVYRHYSPAQLSSPTLVRSGSRPISCPCPDAGHYSMVKPPMAVVALSPA
jgi:hypothetical protein